MKCSRIACTRLATWFTEYANPFQIRKLSDLNIIPSYRMPLCVEHKTADSKPFERIELMDCEDVSPLVIKPKDYFPACKHVQKSVDTENRMVLCVACGEALDAITVLAEIARNFSLKNYKLEAVAEADRRAKEKLQRAKERAARNHPSKD